MIQFPEFASYDGIPEPQENEEYSMANPIRETISTNKKACPICGVTGIIFTVKLVNTKTGKTAYAVHHKERGCQTEWVEND